MTTTQPPQKQAQGPWGDLAFHTLGWKAFQDLCAQTCEEVLKRPVEIYREAQDGGQDAVFLSKKEGNGPPLPATVQCKFTSKAARALKLADLRAEESHITALKAEGLAETYILMTNMSVDGPVAVKIKKRLRQLGVVHPHVFGKEFLTLVIRASPKLRALVPRVYGLGDLSTILDERQAAQTKALLGHMIPTLQVYVHTRPHIEAVHSLDKHGIVLLLGDPATGKSTIAAILATMASEHAGRVCYKIDGPQGLLSSWNPDEPKAFYWIDDAFGPNQPREDFIDQWVAIMPKVQAAIAAGCQFVLTSRRHIYEASKPKLGTRNHPLFRNNEAIVSVGGLDNHERAQILYNHIKAGKQSIAWKARVKPQLETLVKERNLLPEIARRLADPAYTKQITTAYDSLVRFIREPKEHLIQTIEELSKSHRAALTFVFLHRGQMPVGGDPEMQQLVVQHYSVDPEALWQGVSQLRDSFLVQTEISGKLFWTFKHPTVADAVSAILGGTQGLCELYLRGTKSETIIAESVCMGQDAILDAVVIPEALDDLLVERLAEIPDEPRLNRGLFSFLSWRASEKVFRKFVMKHEGILERSAGYSAELSIDPTICVHARAHQFSLLREELRSKTAIQLEVALLNFADTSFLNEDEILALIPPRELMSISLRIRGNVLANIPRMAGEIVGEADLDIDPEDNFDQINEKLSDLRELFKEDDSVKNLIAEAEAAIRSSIEEVAQAKSEKEEEEEEDDKGWHWKDRIPGRSIAVGDTPALDDRRSIFSDVHE